MAKARTPDSHLRRRRGGQGRKYKCPILRELLYDWFVDMRASVAGILSPHFVMKKAKAMGATALQHMRDTGVYGPLPKINKGWLLRWKRDYGVVFRRPNMRFKCSKRLLTQRLRAMWVNNVKVRRLFHHFCGHEASDLIWGIDEKPLHMNEAGSKNVRTLELVGAPSVRLKENHAATRERVSIMTCVTSSPAAATQPRHLPVTPARPRSHFCTHVRSRRLVFPASQSGHPGFPNLLYVTFGCLWPRLAVSLIAFCSGG